MPSLTDKQFRKLKKTYSEMFAINAPAKVIYIKREIKTVPKEENVWFNTPHGSAESIGKKLDINPIYSKQSYVCLATGRQGGVQIFSEKNTKRY